MTGLGMSHRDANIDEPLTVDDELCQCENSPVLKLMTALSKTPVNERCPRSGPGLYPRWLAKLVEL